MLLNTITCAFAICSLHAGASDSASSRTPQVRVRMFADREAIAPGGTIDVALAFQIPAGWHIYWKNRGEGGLETRVDWQLPARWKAGPPRFPPPTRHVDEADAHTFVLERRPVLLCTLTAPSDAKPGDQGVVGAAVSWLICRDLCYAGDQTLSLEIPVVASDAPAKATNAEAFASARERLPSSAEKAPGLASLRAFADVSAVRPGATFRIAVVVDIPPGFVLEASGSPDGLDVFPETVEGVEIGRPSLPDGQPASAGAEPRFHRGRVVVTLPVRADGNLAVKELRFAGVVTYRPTDKSGTKLPPAAAEWSFTIPVVGRDDPVRAVDIEQPPASQPARGAASRE